MINNSVIILAFYIWINIFFLNSCGTNDKSYYTRGSNEPLAQFNTTSEIKIISGAVTIKIYGFINEDLYSTNVRESSDVFGYYDNPSIRKGTITRDTIINISVGESYKIILKPKEIVYLNVISSDGNDAEIIVRKQMEREEKYIINGSNRLGLSILFRDD
jgi:hypothetical protein